MPTAPQTIRNAVRALIFRNGKVLLIRKQGGKAGDRYTLPGGAQNPGETLKQALKRECQEEIGARISIRELAHVADYFKPRNTKPPSTRQAVEFLFICEIADDYAPHNGNHPDNNQLSVVWIKLKNLKKISFQPSSLITQLMQLDSSRGRTYLGEIN